MVAADSDCPDSLPVKQQFNMIVPYQLRRHAGALLGLPVWTHGNSDGIAEITVEYEAKLPESGGFPQGHGQGFAFRGQAVRDPSVHFIADLPGNAVGHFFRFTARLERRGAENGRAGQVVGVFVFEARQIPPVPQDVLLDFSDIGSQAPGIDFVPDTSCRREAHGFAPDGAAADDAGAGHGQSAGADVAAREHQVVDVAAVIAAVGDRIDALVKAAVAGEPVFIQQAVGRVEIDAPAAVADGVLKNAVLQHIVFVEHVVALQAAALTHTGQRAHPVQRQVFGMMVVHMLLVVFDMVPDAVGVGHQVIADFLEFRDDVVSATHQLAPPVAVIAGRAAGHAGTLVFFRVGQSAHVDLVAHVPAVNSFRQLLFRQMLGKRGLLEVHRVAQVFGQHHDGVAHAVIVGLLRRVGLVKLAFRLAAHPVFGPGVIAQCSVAGGVHEYVRPQAQAHFRGFLHAVDGGDSLPFRLAVIHHGIVIDRQVLLLLRRLKQDHVPDGIAEILIAAFVFQHQFVHDPALGVVGLLGTLIRAGDMNAYLAAGVAAQHGPAVDQSGVDPLPGAGQRGAQAAHAAADDQHVVCRFREALSLSFHVFFLRSAVEAQQVFSHLAAVLGGKVHQFVRHAAVDADFIDQVCLAPGYIQRVHDLFPGYGAQERHQVQIFFAVVVVDVQRLDAAAQPHDPGDLVFAGAVGVAHVPADAH